MDEGDRQRAPPPASNFDVADDLLDRPIAALDEDVGAAFEDAFEGRVFVEPSDEVGAFERGHHGQAVFEPIDRPVVAFAQALDRSVGVKRDDHRSPLRARLREEGDMAAVQDVKAAVGEHQRAGQRGETGGEFAGGDDLAFEGGGGVGMRHRQGRAEVRCRRWRHRG